MGGVSKQSRSSDDKLSSWARGGHQTMARFRRRVLVRVAINRVAGAGVRRVRRHLGVIVGNRTSCAAGRWFVA